MKNFFQTLIPVVGLICLAAAHSAKADEPRIPAVRVSRAFFERALETEFRVNAPATGEVGAYVSRSEWVEHPTELPAPAPDETTGPVLADFRDYKGCNQPDSPQGVNLCFNVMPDVSSVGLNAREMSLEGLEQLLPESCADAASTAKLVSAVRDGESFTVAFDLTQPGCEAQVEVTVRGSGI